MGDVHRVFTNRDSEAAVAVSGRVVGLQCRSRCQFVERLKLQLEDEERAQKERQSSNRDSSYGRSSHTDQKKPDNAGTFEDRLRARIKAYCQRSYKQVHTRKQELRSDTVCMRENPFYVDTVRDFRDRRYEFKRLVKTWKGKLQEAAKSGDSEAAVEGGGGNIEIHAGDTFSAKAAGGAMRIRGGHGKKGGKVGMRGGSGGTGHGGNVCITSGASIEGGLWWWMLQHRECVGRRLTHRR